MDHQLVPLRMAVKRGDQVTAPASRQVRDSRQPQPMHKAVPPEILVEECVERPVESQAGRSIHPPRNREVGGSEKSRSGPRQSNRQQREQKRNDPPFARVCAVALHTSPARLRKAEQALSLLASSFHSQLVLGSAGISEIA